MTYSMDKWGTIVNEKGETVLITGVALTMCGDALSNDSKTAKENANLFLEALNVKEQTGFTPNELLQKVKNGEGEL